MSTVPPSSTASPERVPRFTGLPEDDPEPAKEPSRPLSRRERRRWKKLNRTMQDKATRATWRAFAIVFLPFIGIVVTYVMYDQGQPKLNVLIAAGITVGAFLLTGPFILWGSISALRRGTRRLILSLILGFYSGILTVGLIVAILGGAIAYGLLTGQPIPVINQNVDLPGGIR